MGLGLLLNLNALFANHRFAILLLYLFGLLLLKAGLLLDRYDSFFQLNL